VCACGGPLREGLAPHVLRGTFRFDRRIGAGGMGVVYHAVDLGLGREVALKTLPSTTPEHERRLRREAQAMASIVHPNLAVIYGIETWRGTPFLVEEYLAGGTLAHRLEAGPLSVAAALDLAITLCAVLADLHVSGIIHCDLKPSNIGFSQNGTAKLLDFGLAFLLRDASGLTRTTAIDGPAEPGDAESVIITHRGIVGTPPYMCPEAIRGLQPVPGFDLWSLAVVCFEAIAGRRPFLGGNSFEVFQAVASGQVPDLRALQPACPEPVARFFPRALASDPAARPPDADAFRLELSTLRGSCG
jgi:serine/threonine protein kinase